MKKSTLKKSLCPKTSTGWLSGLMFFVFFAFLSLNVTGQNSYRYIKVTVEETNQDDGRLRLNDFKVGDDNNWYSVSGGVWDNATELPAIKSVDLGSAVAINQYDIHTVFNLDRTPRNFTIEASSDNVNWDVIESVTQRESSEYESNTNNIFELDVQEVINVDGVSITDCPGNNLELDDTAQLTAIVSPADATDASVTWESSDASVASVTSSGLVTVLSPGTTDITVTTNDGGYTAQCDVTVNAPQPDAVQFIRVTVTATNQADGRLRLNDFKVGDDQDWHSVSGGLWDNATELPAVKSVDLGSQLIPTQYDIQTVYNTDRTPHDFTIEGSVDNVNWIVLESVSGRASSAYNGNTSNLFEIEGGDPDTDPEPEEFLTVSSSNLSFSSASGSQNVSVSSNVSWTVSKDQSWINVSPVSGDNNGTVAVSVTENTSSQSRSGAVTIAGAGTDHVITVSQQAKISDVDPEEWPSVGMGLDGTNYYQPYSPFVDVIKSVRWIDVASWNENGFPASAQPGTTASARAGVSNGENWPEGHYVLTWEGSGDVKIIRDEVSLVSEDLTDEVNRRVYDIKHSSGYGVHIEVNSYPVDNIKLILPGLEDHPSIWNPAYIEYLRPFSDGPIRFMDLNGTNNSNQSNWADRTPATWSTFVNNNNRSEGHHVKGNASYEAMIELCNEMESDMWITIPHKATDEYVENLAHLIRTGVDKATGIKTTEPLKPGLKVWVEYSNEVWNWNFTQSNWVNNELAHLGDNIDERYARKAVMLFDIFVNEFGSTDRLVRVLSTQIGWGGGMRTRQRIEAVPRDKFDAMALTTYFDPRTNPVNRVLQIAYENWPMTNDQLMDWIEDMVGEGPFVEDDQNEEVVNAYWSYYHAAAHDVPMVSYEGNEHINPVRKVDTNGDGIADTPFNQALPEGVDFIHDMVRTPRFGEIYKTWLDRHHQSGLVTNMPFVMLAGWSIYGQWGHVEYVGQTVEEAQKYKALLDYYNLSYPNLVKSAKMVNGSANFDDKKGPGQVEVFPNPVTEGVITVRFDKEENNLLAIISLEGKVLRNELINGSQKTIDVSDLSSGLYLIQVNKSISKLIIK